VQTEVYERCRGVNKVGGRVVVTDHATDMEAGPAREGCAADSCYGRNWRYGLAAAEDSEIVNGGERRRPSPVHRNAEHPTHRSLFHPFCGRTCVHNTRTQPRHSRRNSLTKAMPKERRDKSCHSDQAFCHSKSFPSGQSVAPPYGGRCLRPACCALCGISCVVTS
jgi:hypothetical protein